MSEVQYISTNGKPAFAVLRVEDYQRLVCAAAGAVKEAEYFEIMAAIKSGEEETFPADFVGRLIETKSPLREWRKYRRMTQVELAATSGLSQGAIAQIEAGKRNPSVETARKFANALNCDIDDLF
jgi:DNA-binding XRE family transcriptional regulator